jgi:hypothetical protein
MPYRRPRGRRAGRRSGRDVTGSRTAAGCSRSLCSPRGQSCLEQGPPRPTRVGRLNHKRGNTRAGVAASSATRVSRWQTLVTGRLRASVRQAHGTETGTATGTAKARVAAVLLTGISPRPRPIRMARAPPRQHSPWAPSRGASPKLRSRGAAVFSTVRGVAVGTRGVRDLATPGIQVAATGRGQHCLRRRIRRRRLRRRPPPRRPPRPHPRHPPRRRSALVRRRLSKLRRPARLRRLSRLRRP